MTDWGIGHTFVAQATDGPSLASRGGTLGGNQALL